MPLHAGDQVAVDGDVWHVWATHGGGDVTLFSDEGTREPSFIRCPAASLSRVEGGPGEAGLDQSGLVGRFWAQYDAARAYDAALVASAERRWVRQLRRWSCPGPAGAAKVGFVFGTFSPVHNGHLALVDRAVRDLGLDHVYVITWPFVRIQGFHPSGMRAWVRDQQHLGWSDRVALLRAALADRPVTVLTEGRSWYGESRRVYSRDAPLSMYWTGMWYVARKLQWFLDRSAGGPVGFTQLCGSDQFNLHVARLLAPDTHQPWNDYSITRALATHDLYVVPRNEARAPVEWFSPPDGCPRTVTFGATTPQHELSAAAIRFGLLDPGQRLEDVTPGPVARRVRARGWWGY
jgi:hypothetical protein